MTNEVFKTILVNELKDNMTLIICSDHGNIEDISVKTHTLNPSIAVASGNYAEELSNEINDLSQIKPAIMKILK